jgi:hypothetical protein
VKPLSRGRRGTLRVLATGDSLGAQAGPHRSWRPLPGGLGLGLRSLRMFWRAGQRRGPTVTARCAAYVTVPDIHWTDVRCPQSGYQCAGHTLDRCAVGLSTRTHTAAAAAASPHWRMHCVLACAHVCTSMCTCMGSACAVRLLPRRRRGSRSPSRPHRTGGWKNCGML